MKLGVLFSGGKDSCLALNEVIKKGNTVSCLISLISKNKESYMFHTPNINITKIQAKCLDIPLLQQETEGKKEEELMDLKKGIIFAIKKYKIEGIVTGAIQSVYQSSRIQKICDELNIKCINPLWQKDQLEILNKIIEEKMEVIISGVFAYPLEKELLGNKIDNLFIKKMKKFKEKYKINPAGEGGEIETTVLDMPIFKKRIKIINSEIKYYNYAGNFIIKKAKIQDK